MRRRHQPASPGRRRGRAGPYYGRRLEHGLSDRGSSDCRGGAEEFGKAQSERAHADRRASPAPAAASRSSAAARPTSATPRGRSAPAEIEACKKAGIEYIELPIAYDGLAIVVNPKNTWATTITVAELKTLWAPEAQGKITRWNQVRAGWPDREIHLFGAGVDSGTYDYFTEAIVGKARRQPRRLHVERGRQRARAGRRPATSSRSASCRSPTSRQNKRQAEARAGRRREGRQRRRARSRRPPRPCATAPTSRCRGRSSSTSSRKAADRPEVQQFVEFYFDAAPSSCSEVGYVELTPQIYELAEKHFAERKTGHGVRRRRIAGRHDARSSCSPRSDDPS